MKSHLFYLLLFFSFFDLKSQNDCNDFVEVCGNRGISLNVSGGGNQEINNANWCFVTENNSLWLKFTIVTSGTLGFNLVPTSTNLAEDYDFMIFGPNVSCNNKGNPIRCSSTNPQAQGASNNHTGLRASSSDQSEGPGALGDSWLQWLTVTAGETYFLLIDRPIGNAAFSLNWTGTAALQKYNAGTDKTICLGEAINMNATNSTGMSWLQHSSNPKTVSISSTNSSTTQVSGFTKPGTYKFLWSSVGCEDTVDVFVKDTSLIQIAKTICSGQSFNGHSTTGIFVNKYTKSNGCDSTVELNLTVNPSSSSNFSVQICSQQSYFFNGQNRTTTGSYTQTLTNSKGCDSIVTLSLSVVDSIVSNFTFSKCPNEPYFFNGQNRFSFGKYKDTFQSSGGCDSFVYMTLTPKEFKFKDIKSICDGQSYRSHSVSGIFKDTMKSFYGCDSIIETTLTVLKPVYRDTVYYYGCQSYIHKTITYFKDTVLNETILNHLNCDSIYRVSVITIRPAPIRLSSIRYDFCDSILVDAKMRYNSFDFDAIIKAKDTPHCDSLITKIEYIKHNTTELKITATPLDTIFIKGENITLKANKLFHYLWNNGDTMDFIREKVVQDKQFVLIGWNDSFCKDTVTFDLRTEEVNILDFPTAFHPNSEIEENRRFKPNMFGKLRSIRFEIYNRWGEKVFGTNSTQSAGWDGTYRSESLPAGIYTYVVEYNVNRRIFFRTGEFSLIR